MTITSLPLLCLEKIAAKVFDYLANVLKDIFSITWDLDRGSFKNESTANAKNSFSMHPFANQPHQQITEKKRQKKNYILST